MHFAPLNQADILPLKATDSQLEGCGGRSLKQQIFAEAGSGKLVKGYRFHF